MTPSDPWRNLAAGIVSNALKDARCASDPGRARAARLWLLTAPLCKDLLEYLDLDARRFRRWVLALG